MLLNGLGSSSSFKSPASSFGWKPAPNIVVPTTTALPVNKGTLIQSRQFDKFKSRSNPFIYNPVNQAVVDSAVNKLNNTSTNTTPAVNQPPPTQSQTPLVIPPPYSGGGGGGSAGSSDTSSDTSNDSTQQTPPTSLADKWANLSTISKLAIAGGGIVIIYYGYKMFKGGRAATAPKSI